MITIKKKTAGSYFVEECPEIMIYKSELGNWITVGKGYEDVSNTKREAVAYAEWIYNFTS